MRLDGDIVMEASDTKLYKSVSSLIGKELYEFKNKAEVKHQGMHSLIGMFIDSLPAEHLDSATTLYPFKLNFPGGKSRVYYLETKEEQQKWITAIREVVGYANLFDFYEMKQALGKGKFGLVKEGIHKKTGKSVAIKIMSKSEMTVSDVEL